MEDTIRTASKVMTSPIMKRPRHTEDESVGLLCELTKASDAISKKYKQLQEQTYLEEKVLNDMWKLFVTPLKK